MTAPKPMSTKTLNTSGWLAAFAAALMGFLGGRTTAPSQSPPPTKPDTAVVVTVPPADTHPVPTPPVVPPPVVTPPVLTPPVASALLNDDFTGYTSTAELLAAVAKRGGAQHPELITLDTSVRYNGHPTMKYNQPGGTANTPQFGVTLPTPTTHVWVRTHVRFSPGYTTTGTIGGASAYKLFGWGFPGYDGSGRLEVTNINQYDFYWGVQDRASGRIVGGGDATHVSPGYITSEWNDGAWYTYIAELDYSRSPAVTRLYMARGTEKPVLRATNTGMLPTQSLPINAIVIGMNFNQVRAANQTQALWWGDYEIVDGSVQRNPFGV